MISNIDKNSSLSEVVDKLEEIINHARNNQNKIIYEETTNEHFNTGILNDVYAEDNCLKMCEVGIDDNVILLLHGEDLTDSSFNPKTLSCSGATIDANGKFGKCIKSTLNTTIRFNHSSVAFGTGDFTIDCWFNMNDYGSNVAVRLFATTSYTENNGIICEFRASSKQFVAYSGYSSSFLNYIYTPEISLNTWYHFAYVRKNGVSYLFLNGKCCGQTPLTNNLTSTSFSVACEHATSTSGLPGYIDEFRVSNVARWTEDFDPPRSKYISQSYTGSRKSPNINLPIDITKGGSYWDGDGSTTLSYYSPATNEIDSDTILMLKCEDYTDSSLDPKTVNNIGTTINNNGKFGKGISLGSSGQYLKVPNGIKGLDFSKDFTIDWWEYSTGASGSCGVITTRMDPKGAHSSALLLGHGGTLLYTGNSTSWNGFASVPVKDKVDNVWVHWALVKQGTKWTTYKNGVQFWTDTNPVVVGKADGDNISIGTWVNDTTTVSGYNAIIDEFRISKVARWTTNFTPMERGYSSKVQKDIQLTQNSTIDSFKAISGTDISVTQTLEPGQTISNFKLVMFGSQSTTTIIHPQQ